MLEEIRGLLILQDRDKRLLAIAKDLAKLPQAEARARAKLAGDEEALKQAKDALNEAELRVKKIEMDAETRRTTIKRLRVQQFETKKNEEYNALGHEITRYEKEVDEYETKELQAMEEVDVFRVKFQEANEQIGKVREVVEADLVAIRERHARMEEQQKEVKAERDKLVQSVSEDILPLYEKLLKSKDGTAIVTLHGGQCTGCNMKVITSTAIAVQSEKEITQCENCGRILAMDE
jgi:predicted  nucleic acid-binding Zn-ribbon protein